jgi:hypothetical protein
MRSLSLAVIAATSLFVGIGLAQAAYLGQPFHAGPLAAHRAGPTEHHTRVSSDLTALYIVQLKDAPAALYRGGVAGYGTTNPRMKGQRVLDTYAPETRAYVDYLGDRQAEMLARARGALGRSLTPRFQYRYALNGMSLRLTAVEAFKLAQLDGVLSVEPVRYYKPTTSVNIPATAGDTNASRAWINAPGVWQLPSNSNPDTEGEGIVVADVDTGINDANSSFAALGPLDSYTAVNPLGPSNYLGVCSSSPTTTKPTFFNCNAKLIGAYSYTLSTGNDPNSPEDSEGHGSHTASTMVGDFTTTTVNGVTIPLSGVAPHASIIAYDVCDPTDSCPSDGAAAAIEQAIQDQSTLKSANRGFKGMVLNYSIGGGDATMEDPYTDPVELAFLSAVEAGIYVSAAGGNGGPANVIQNDPTDFPVYPVEHVTPWVTSTAAATHSGVIGNNLESFTGGDSGTLPSSSMLGTSNTSGIGPVNIVYAGTSNYLGDDPVITGDTPFSSSGSIDTYPSSQGSGLNAQLCLYPFNPGTFPSGSIVVCDRGTNLLIDKAYNVGQGGAGGVVIAATSSSSQDMVAESYAIPGILIDQTDGNILRTWLKKSFSGGVSATAEAQITDAVLTIDTAQADQVAGFSSRGPTNTVFDDLVKPELTAPGVSVLAAFSNPAYTAATPGGSNTPETYAFDDGTSMASPHDAASAGLLMALHPSWTPAEIRSGLMLTAVTTANGVSPGLTDQCASLDSGENCVAGSSLPSPQVRGAGRIDVEAANSTGLLLDENGTDYANANPDNGGDLTTLNLPGMANSNCVTTCNWTRTFTSAFASASPTYSVSVSGLTSGLKLKVSSTSFSLAPGATQQLVVTADASGVQAGVWAFGEIDITTSDTGDGGATIPAMHLPVSVLSTAPAAHMSIDQSGLSFALTQGASSTSQFIISNDGQVMLDWKLSTVAGSSTQSLAAQAVASAKGKPLSTSTVWNQSSGGASGLGSDFFSPDNHGVYVADTFSVPVKADITEIVAPGFAQDTSGLVLVAGTVHWYIYADASDKPAGDPDDGKNDYVWHYSADAASVGVDVNGGTITLDLTAAGQSAAQLAAGSYWLIVAPTFSSEATDSSAAKWFWFESKSTAQKAMFIDPGNLFGSGTAWEPVQASMAFTLSGSLDCSGSAMQGLSLSASSGSVKAGANQTVTATFNSGGLADATYNGAICVSGNASDNPQIVLPVTATVSGGSSGKGGGGLDLLTLAGLAWAMRRKRFR